MTDIVPVILSGGSGTRLWPLSRTLYPKQLQALYGDHSMLQETAARTSGDGFAAPIIICNNEHRFIIAEQMLEIGISPRTIFLEPIGRNTAPAAAVAAIVLAAQDPDTLMMVVPSDHLIRKPDDFADVCAVARKAAMGGKLVTFGVEPRGPETGYGYIQQGAALDQADGAFHVARFVEKPDLETAQDYLNIGGYFWNSGMFLFKAGAYLAELERLQPEMLAACQKAVDCATTDMDFTRLDEAAFSQAPSDSIDYAVMEHTDKAAVAPADIGWNDVGSWSELWHVGVKDDAGNVFHGDVVSLDVHDSYIRSSGPLTTAIGVKDLVVVVTDDAVLVMPKDRAQDVKGVVDGLRGEGRSEGDAHRRMYRPWGWYQSIDSGEKFQAKQLMVKYGGILSLQSHKRRAEHWVVVSGRARITRGDEVFQLEANQSTYIPPGTKHRLENPYDEPLRIIEVQSGEYLGEDDIERFEDIYGRD